MYIIFTQILLQNLNNFFLIYLLFIVKKLFSINILKNKINYIINKNKILKKNKNIY